MGQNLDAVDLKLVPLAAVSRFARNYLARQFYRTFLFKLRGHAVIGKSLRIDALYRLPRRAQNDKREIGHHANVVDGARDGDFLIFILAEIRIRDRICLRFACYYHNESLSVFLTNFLFM